MLFVYKKLILKPICPMNIYCEVSVGLLDFQIFLNDVNTCILKVNSTTGKALKVVSFKAFI